MGDDRTQLEALGEYLAMYPPDGFADRYSAAGWTHIARGVLSAAAIFMPGAEYAARIDAELGEERR